MTRKDYVLIADSIKGAINYEAILNDNKEKAEALGFLAIRLSSAFELDNPRFDRDRFLVACGVN